MISLGFYASIMAACALASARVRDGAMPGAIPETLKRNETTSEVFYTAAKEAFSKDLSETKTVEYVRACTLLSLTCIQYGNAQDVQQFLGRAFTITAMSRFYDEKHWPSDISESHRETYRRIFWSTYTLDIYSAVVWNCFLRSQELHTTVQYPRETKDDKFHMELFTESGRSVSWLEGFNFSLDLYRVLEHVIGKARAKQFKHDDRRSVETLVFESSSSDRNVMHNVLHMYYELPRQFKETSQATGDMKRDIFGFQAANIQATLQLLRMILFSLEDGPGVERKCDVVNEVLQVFHTIPVDYLRAISTPLIYQLGSIGQILGSVLEEPVSHAVYDRVRAGLVSMAELLQNLETVLHRSAGAAQGLLSQIAKLDQYMATRHKSPQPSASQNTSPGVESGSGGRHAIPSDPIVQLAPMMHPLEMDAEWPWAFFQEGLYFPGNMNTGGPF